MGLSFLITHPKQTVDTTSKIDQFFFAFFALEFSTFTKVQNKVDEG